jgi:hypothetical protein
VPADVSVPVARGSRQDVSVTAPAGAAGRRLGWSVAQHAVAHAKGLHIRAVEYDGLGWPVGRPSERGWTAASAPRTTARVSLGQAVECTRVHTEYLNSSSPDPWRQVSPDRGSPCLNGMQFGSRSPIRRRARRVVLANCIPTGTRRHGSVGADRG